MCLQYGIIIIEGKETVSRPRRIPGRREIKMKISKGLIEGCLVILKSCQKGCKARLVTKEELLGIISQVEENYKRKENHKVGAGYIFTKGGVSNSYRGTAYGTQIRISLEKGKSPEIRISRVPANYVSKERARGFYSIYE